MGISISLLITMTSVSLGGAILEKVLGKIGKIDEANMVGMVTTSMLVTTVVASAAKVFVEVKKLGN